MDIFTKEERSKLMSGIQTVGTDIEKNLLECVKPFWKKEQYRKNVKKLPGKPDIVFSKSKLVVFADGDWWHGKVYKQIKDKIPPFWQEKIASNIARDKKHNKQLKKMGYKVLRFWGSFIKKHPGKVIKKIRENLSF